MKLKTKSNISLILGIIFGLFFIVKGYQSYLDISSNDFENPIEATGIIKNIYSDKVGSHTFISEDNKRYAPRVEFTTTDGQKIDFIDFTQFQDEKSFDIGDEVIVIYEFNNPYAAVIKTENPLLGMPLVTIGIGVGVILISIGLYRL